MGIRAHPSNPWLKFGRLQVSNEVFIKFDHAIKLNLVPFKLRAHCVHGGEQIFIVGDMLWVFERSEVLGIAPHRFCLVPILRFIGRWIVPVVR